jgi:predicted Zn-dependent peptidase
MMPVFLAVAILAGVARTQEPEPGPAGAPAGKPATEWTLANGLRARLAPMDTPGESAVILCLEGAGFLCEPAGLARMAQLGQLAIVLTRGDAATTAAMSRWMKANAVEWRPEETSLTFEIWPKPDEVPTAIEALAERFFNPTLDPAAWKVLRPRVLAVTLASHADTPEGLEAMATSAWSACNQIAFHSETEVRFEAPSPLIDPSSIRAFHRATFRPERAMITVLGDFDVGAAKKRIEELLAKPGAVESRPASRRTLAQGTREGSWDVPSHHLFMLWPAPSPQEKTYAALRLFAPVLRAALKKSSEVVKHVRQVSVFGDAGGLFVIQAPLRARNGSAEAVRAIRSVLAANAAEPFRYLDVTKDELRRNAAIHEFPGAPLETRVAPTRARMLDVLRTGGPFEAYAARVEAVTSDEIHAAMKTWLTPEKATIVTVVGKE